METSRERVDPRRVAWETLIAVEQGAFADAELGRRLAAARLEVRDRSLATLLVYGTLAWQGLLDHVIAGCLTPARQQAIDEPVRILLRMAMFQLSKLSRVPEFAVVNTAVELSKTFRGGAVAGFVNAVLRRFLRDGKRISLPSRDEDLAGYLALALSHPHWLVRRWLDELGPQDAEALMEADNEAAPTVLRVNSARTNRESLLESWAAAGVSARAGRYSPEAIVLDIGADPRALGGFAQGLFTVQGEASQLITALVGVRPGDRVLDACAAPGGKSSQLAGQLDDRGMILAVDRNAHGLVHLRGTVRRLGLRGVRVVRADALHLPVVAGTRFDAVLLDAPCSGLGTLRQHPEIRWRRSPAAIAELAELQTRLLAVLSIYVRHGGCLVYATCTISKSENERVIESFLAAHPDFIVDDATPWLPASARGLVGADGFFRSFPHRDGLDGFFAARLARH